MGNSLWLIQGDPITQEWDSKADLKNSDWDRALRMHIQTWNHWKCQSISLLHVRRKGQKLSVWPKSAMAPKQELKYYYI